MLNALKQELAELSEKPNRRSKIESMLGSLRSEKQALWQKEYDLSESVEIDS